MRMERIGKHVREPDVLHYRMNAYRKGYAGLPTEYIRYHTALAKLEAGLLQDEYGFNILRERMVSDGWMDGMQVLELIVETKLLRLHRLRYQDSTGEFMIHCPSGGWAALFIAKDLK